MFDFEFLEVYKKAKTLNHEVFDFIKHHKQIDSITSNQLRRASFSIMLNIAEGTSRFTKPDKRNFYIISRGSVHECVAIFDFLENESILDSDLKSKWYQKAEELSKMLYTMIKNLEPARTS